MCRLIRNGADSHESDSSGDGHVVFKITISEDEDYALDITGAQFGFYDPVTPWASYQQNRIETLGTIRPLKHLRGSHGLDGDDRGGWFIERTALKGHFTKIFGSPLRSWQAKNGAFSVMLKLREELFRKRQVELLNFIDGCIEAGKKQTF